MDPALLKERASFLKRAKAQPAVEKKKHKSSKDESSSKKLKSKSSEHRPKPSVPIDYKTAQGSSQFQFGVLTKIVKHMRTRHQNGDTFPLSIEDMLDETNQLDIGARMKHWLISEALVNNPKLKVVHDGDGTKYAFKPKYDVRDKKSLLKLLKNYDLYGTGGILQEDIEESLPNAAKALKHLGDYIIYVTRPIDKKKVLFYNDKYCLLNVDDEFKKMWRSVGVEGLDERKIEEYLEKQGISSMQELGVKKVTQVKRKKSGGGRKNKLFKKHNDHLDGVLQDYSDKT